MIRGLVAKAQSWPVGATLGTNASQTTRNRLRQTPHVFHPYSAYRFGYGFIESALTYSKQQLAPFKSGQEKSFLKKSGNLEEPKGKQRHEREIAFPPQTHLEKAMVCFSHGSATRP